MRHRRLFRADHASWSRATALGGLELLTGRFIDQTFAPHSHETFAIGIVEAGALSFWYRGATYRAHAGAIIAIHPRETHTGGPLGAHGWRYRMMYPCEEVLRHCIGPKQREDIFFPSPVIYDAACAAELSAAHRLLAEQENPQRGESACAHALRLLVRRHGHERSPDARHGIAHPAAIQRALAFLESHHPLSIHLEEVAAAAELSPCHLIRVFRARLGMTPFAYLTHLRVSASQRLLRAGVPIPRAAYLTGFADQSHLTRQFKRIVGVTPAQFARGGLRNVMSHRASAPYRVAS